MWLGCVKRMTTRCLRVGFLLSSVSHPRRPVSTAREPPVSGVARRRAGAREGDTEHGYHSQSKDEQTSVTNTLTANGVVGGANLSASLTTALTTTMSSTTTRTTLQQQIYGVTGLTFPAASDIASFALTFGTIPPNAPTVISFATRPGSSEDRSRPGQARAP